MGTPQYYQVLNNIKDLYRGTGRIPQFTQLAYNTKIPFNDIIDHCHNTHNVIGVWPVLHRMCP